MIESINSFAGTNNIFPERVNYKMTDEQKAQFAEIIKKYDPKNMTDENREELFKELKDTGIKPGDDLKNLMEAAGFKMQPHNHKHHDNGRQNTVDGTTPNSNSDVLNSFISKFKDGTATQDDLNSLVNWIQSNNQSSVGNIVDENT